MDVTELHATTTDVFGPRLDALQRNAVIICVLGLVLSAVGAFMDLQGFFHSYLYAYMFWLGVTVGSLALLMIHHVVGGGWSFLIRRHLEAGSRLLPWLLLLFVPVVTGLLYFGLYEWARPEAANDPTLRLKSAYLNVPFFIARTVLYFAIWIAFAAVLNRWGAIQNERNDPDVFSRLNVLGGAGLVVYALTMTFASVDWVMSLTPHWYSSIFGMLVVVSQGLSTLALMLVLTWYLAGDQPLLRRVPSGYFRDLGNLMLAFVMLWGYMSLSQYLITYSGNTAEEITWYVRRGTGGWEYVSLLLIPLHFFLPFIVLIVGSGIKRNPSRLARIAGFILFMRFVDLFWWVTPTFRKTIGLSLADLGTPLLIGGIWLGLWAGQMRDQPLVPVHDPRLEGDALHSVVGQEVVEHGAHRSS